MDITRITDKNFEAFKDLFPEDFVLNAGKLSFGVVSNDQEAISCMSLEAYDEDLVYIDWIFTHPEYREMGAATELFDTVFAFLQEMSIKTVMVVFHSRDEGLEDFLWSQGFAVSEGNDVYEMTLSDIVYSAGAEELMERETSPVSLFNVHNEQQFKNLGALLRENGIDDSVVFDLSARHSLLAQNADGDINGCILCRDTEDEDVNVLFFFSNHGVNTATDLVAELLRILYKEDPSGRKLFFTDPSGHSANFLGNLTQEDPDSFRVSGIMRAVATI